MGDSIAQPGIAPGSVSLPVWKTSLSFISALLLAIIMLAAGIWKLTSPIDAAARLNQALVPAALSLPAAFGFGISETFCGILLLLPRFRRWGAWIGGLLLVAFILYIGIFYNRLAGEDCNCFPWIQRAVGPAFFVGDGVMLLFAVLAGLWAAPAGGVKGAAAVLVAVCVFAGASYGIVSMQPHGKMAPDAILVGGQPMDLHTGKTLLFFFDPECTHCLFAAREMTGYTWKDVSIVVIPTERPQFAQNFLDAAGMQAPISSDVAKLREFYSFGDPPYVVALSDGATLAEWPVLEDAATGDMKVPANKALHDALAELGFVE